MPGYFKVSRELLEHKIWLKGPFNDGSAWIDLIGLACWKESSFISRGIRIKLKRGQLGWSMKKLGERWQWSPGKVKRYLEWLENEHQIEHKIIGVTTLIIITNYDAYQADEHKNEHKTNTKRTLNEHIQEGKEGKEGKEEEERGLKETSSVIGNHMEPDDFMSRWNRLVEKKPKLQRCLKMSADRKKKLRDRQKDSDWLPTFRIAVAALPLGGDWQPSMDWFLRNKDNAYRIAEGEFDWKNESDAAKKLARKRRSNAEVETMASEEKLKRERKCNANENRKIITRTLAAQNGNAEETRGSSPLFNIED